MKRTFFRPALLAMLVFVALSCKASDEPSTGGGGTTLPEQPETGDVKILITSTNRAYDLKRDYTDFSTNAAMSPLKLTLNPDKRYQSMDGFGAAVTGSSCYNLLKMSQEDRTSFLTETYSDTQGWGFSYIRIAIGCSDFSMSEYTCCDKEGIQNFALTSEELNYVIPVLKEILAINPNVKIMGSPWTCPRWMKVNNLTELKPYNSWTSGQLNPAYYADYAAYFVKWIQAFQQQGINIYSITPQNEPLNRANSASLYMGWEEQRDFVIGHLAPAIKAAGLKTRIYLFDHNYNYDNITSQTDYPYKIYQAGVDSEIVVGAAYHNYGGNRSELLDIHSKAPDKELIFSEASIGEWNDGRNLQTRLMADMVDLGLGIINNWCRAVVVWNLMLDTNKGPNRNGGCQTCYGAVDIDAASYKTITRNSHYYVMAHLSDVVKPGAVRIDAAGYDQSGVSYTAFENTDGTYALVLLNNSSEARKITVGAGEHYFTYQAPANSVLSYQWSK